MPLRKLHKKDLKSKMKDQNGDTLHHGKLPNDKVKYKHKNYWLEQGDDDYVPPNLKEEEE